MNMVQYLEDVVAILNLESSGPNFYHNLNSELFDIQAKMLYASRAIILCGLANQRSPEKELQGPVPVTELSSSPYSFYYFQLRPHLKGLQNIHLVIGLIFKTMNKKKFKPIEDELEAILISSFESLDFSLISPESADPKLKEQLNQIFENIFVEINSLLESSNSEKSIFNLGFLVNLSGDESKLAKKLMLFPDGLLLNTLSIDEQNTLNLLEQKGLIEKHESDEGIVIIPQ